LAAHAVRKALVRLFTLEGVQCTNVYYAPRGGTVLLANLQSLEGDMTFYDVKRRVEHRRAEHVQATGATWDPSGRYCVTYKTQPFAEDLKEDLATRHRTENGYILWTFQGNLIHQETGIAALYQLQWRPRPSTWVSYAPTADELRVTVGDAAEESTDASSSSSSSATSSSSSGGGKKMSAADVAAAEAAKASAAAAAKARGGGAAGAAAGAAGGSGEELEDEEDEEGSGAGAGGAGGGAGGPGAGKARSDTLVGGAVGLLSAKQLRAILQDLPEISRRYEAEDGMRAKKTKLDSLIRKRILRDEFERLLRARRAHVHAAPRAGPVVYQSVTHEEVVDEVVEELLL
jgi:Eukaryotic translation initiation factor eIF2A